MGSSTEGSYTYQYLSWILDLVEGDSLKDIMRLQAQRRRLARAEEMGDVLHLYEWHRRLFVTYARWTDS